MNKLKYAFYATLALALMAIPAMAQGAADNESSVLAAKAIGGGIGFGLAAGLVAGRVARHRRMGGAGGDGAVQRGASTHGSHGLPAGDAGGARLDIRAFLATAGD